MGVVFDLERFNRGLGQLAIDPLPVREGFRPRPIVERAMPPAFSQRSGDMLDQRCLVIGGAYAAPAGHQ